MTNTRLHMDGDTLIEHRSADVEPVLEEVKALRSMGATGGSEFRHAARVDRVVIEQYCTTAGSTFSEFMGNQEHIRRMLNSPDLSGFRVWQGRV